MRKLPVFYSQHFDMDVEAAQRCVTDIVKLHACCRCNCLDLRDFLSTCRGVCTFSYFSLSRRHTFSIAIPFQKQPLPGYPEHPLTIGEHIRKKRMDLGLLQREVAEIIGVTESSIWNWEHGVEPELQYNPKIIKFLGYIPFDCPDDTVGRLAWPPYVVQEGKRYFPD